MCAKLIKTYFEKTKRHTFHQEYSHLIFGGEHHLVNSYLEQALRENGCMVPLLADSAYKTPSECENFTGRAILFLGVDCTSLSRQKTTLEELEFFFSYMKKHSGCKAVISVLLPEIPAFSDSVKALAEREFNFWLEECFNPTPAFDYYLQLEKRCRQAVREDGLEITLIRFSNVFAPDCAHTPSQNLSDIVTQAFQKGYVEITGEDYQDVFSISYIRSAVYNLFLALEKGLPGHIYNGDEKTATTAFLKQQIRSARPDLFGIREESAPLKEVRYHALSALKLQGRGEKHPQVLAEGIKHLVSFLTETEFDTTVNIAFYEGKIETIQKLEMHILAEIDRICRANNIQYFLAGGSLLGAVRAGGAIEWDDDLDIGMLRDDFEKFKKVCSAGLTKGFSYSGPKNGSHYTIHKIRLDSTYFSTRFSGKNVFEDGIFIDLLIYDKTSNFKIFQKIHGFLLTALTTIMLIKWFNQPRRNYHYRFSQITLPILRIIPWCVFHGLFDFIAKWYRYKKNAKYLVDTVGKKVNDGPLPNQGLDRVVYVDFDGMQAPIPADPIPYLLYAYGPNYNQLPPLSQRRCPHNFSRIDLGRYIFSPDESKPFRAVDIRGELFEEETKQ